MAASLVAFGILGCIAFTMLGCGSDDNNGNKPGKPDGPLGPGNISKVKVEVWTESGCPHCRNFISKPLLHAVQAINITNIMYLEMWPFGNAYYMTEDYLCGGMYSNESYVWYNKSGWRDYSKSIRLCFNQNCGKDEHASNQPRCYVDGPYCQHGKAECEVNTLQACAVKGAMALNESSYLEYVPFMACMEDEYATIAGSVKKGLTPNYAVINQTVKWCAKAGTRLAEEILMCYYTDHKNIDVKMAQNTPPHDGVPLIRITNMTGVPVTLNLTDSSEMKESTLLTAVCNAWEYNGGNRSAAGCPPLESSKIVGIFV